MAGTVGMLYVIKCDLVDYNYTVVRISDRMNGTLMTASAGIRPNPLFNIMQLFDFDT